MLVKPSWLSPSPPLQQSLPTTCLITEGSGDIRETAAVTEVSICSLQLATAATADPSFIVTNSPAFSSSELSLSVLSPISEVGAASSAHGAHFLDLAGFFALFSKLSLPEGAALSSVLSPSFED